MSKPEELYQQYKSLRRKAVKADDAVAKALTPAALEQALRYTAEVHKEVAALEKENPVFEYRYNTQK